MQRYIKQDPLDLTVKADRVFTKSLMSVMVVLAMCKQTEEEVGQGMSAAWCASGQRQCPTGCSSSHQQVKLDGSFKKQMTGLSACCAYTHVVPNWVNVEQNDRCECPVSTSCCLK